MNPDRFGGLALIASSALSLAVIPFHPTAHDFLREGSPWAGLRMLAVHAALLLTLPLSLSGTLALRRRAGSALGELALLVQAAALTAGLVAAGVSLAVPAIAPRAAAAQQEVHALLLGYSGALIQAFAGVMVSGSWLSIALFSAAGLRDRWLPRALGLLGVGITGLGCLLLFSGHLRLTAHGFALVLLSQATFFVPAGLLLLKPVR
jgi:hypothetical protein